MGEALADKKLRFIELVTKVNDESLLQMIEQLLTANPEIDWGESLSDEDRANIQEGLSDLKDGRTETYESFKKTP